MFLKWLLNLFGKKSEPHVAGEHLRDDPQAMEAQEVVLKEMEPRVPEEDLTFDEDEDWQHHVASAKPPSEALGAEDFPEGEPSPPPDNDEE
jgi:hypothetical protein